MRIGKNTSPALSAHDRGGPANLTGVHYQMLTSFQRMAKAIRVLSEDREGDAGLLRGVTLVIEPRGGGDSSLAIGSGRRIQQIKAHQGNWTLAALVDRPFQDLFRAYQSHPEVESVELVTSGNLGRDAREFLGMLAGFSASGDWEEGQSLPWFKSTGRSKARSASATFGELIDDLEKKLPMAGPQDGDSSLHRSRIKGFLRRLSISANVSFEDQEQECHEFLQSWGIARGATSGAIDQLVGYLLRIGKEGQGAVTFEDVAMKLGLAERELANWGFLSSLSRQRVLDDLARPLPGYSKGRDVRRSDPLGPILWHALPAPSLDSATPEGLPEVLPSISRPCEPVVVWGRSGIGKTWLLARTAFQLAGGASPLLSPGPALLWLSSRQDPQADLEEAARKFCHHLWGRETLSMPLLAEQVRRLARSAPQPWLIVFVDGVQSESYLHQLSQLPHGELGILLVVAATIRLDDEPRLGMRFLEAPGFDQNEVLELLESRNPLSQGVPPPDVRKLLETPIFCSLYAALKEDGTVWQPEDEYDLVQRFWLKRIARPRTQAADLLALLSLARMRAAVTSNASPPARHGWSMAELRAFGFSQEDLDALERAAVFVRDPWSRSYSFSHERILHWAAAEGALRSFQAGDLQTEELVQLSIQILTGENRGAFSYAPADLLWLLLDPELPEACRSAAESILRELEQGPDLHRLEDWLVTLGERLVPVLVARLRAADRESSSVLYAYRDALKKIPGAATGQAALQLLAEPSLELQEVGVALLGEREYPPALEALWPLYQEWWNAAHAKRPPSADGRREGPWMYHVDIGERALRRSVRNHPEWLEQKLLAARSLGGANSTLLFLLASTPKGEQVWRRHKDLFRSRLQEDRQRGFVRCIVAFRDQEEVAWLESKLGESRDLVDPSARGALALLAPEKALAPIDPNAFLDSVLARGWWLRMLRIRLPEETIRFVERLILENEDPVKAASAFSDFELIYSPEVLRYLLGVVAGVLAAYRRGERETGKDRLRVPLLRLSDCNTLDQLEVFWDSGNNSLESDLADWLIGLGPNDTYGNRGITEEEGAELLKLMAGPSLARVGRSLLERAVTWPAGRDGLDLAVRQPGPDVVGALRVANSRPVLSPAKGNEHPVLQRECVSALAYLRDFEGFGHGVIQWGLQLPPDLMAFLDDKRESPQLLTIAKEALEGDAIPSGALLLLGMHGGEEAIDLLKAQRREDLDSADRHVAWILGLDESGDVSPETLAIFAEGLGSTDPRIHYCSWKALLRRRDQPAAQELLLSMVSLGQRDSERVALWLLEREELKRSVAERVWARRNDRSFLFHYATALEHLAVLGTDDVKRFLVDHAMGDSNPTEPEARHSAIRGLASFDRDVALRAALACRQEDRKTQSRAWPALVLEVGRLEALPHLREELATCEDLVRLYALGEALRREQQASILQSWLADEDPRVREGACYAACAQAFDSDLEMSIVRCCLDPEEDVRNAAQEAFEHLWQDREVGRLIVRLRDEPHHGRRWALLDSALNIGYPGVLSGFGRVSWFSELIRDRPYYEVQYATDRLKERRKKLVEGLERKSKDFREEGP